MTRKQKALKGLMVLALVIALCMFFARTVQTITTPKVQRITATRGKLEQKIQLTGSIYFEDTESFKVSEARKLGITVDRIRVKAGAYVKEGDVLFTAYATEYDSKMKELQTKYDEAVGKLAEEYAAHIRQQQHSEHNVLYNQLMDDMDAYYVAVYQVMATAVEEGYTLGKEDTWDAITDAPEKTAAALQVYVQARDAMNASATKLRLLYKTGSGRVGEATFDYIKKIDGFKSDIAKVQQDMLELDALNTSLTAIRAPRAGYVMEIAVKEGEAYDGSKTAYVLSAESAEPSLRADITSISKTISKGNKVELKDSGASTQVEDVQVTGDGKKYAVIKLDSKTLKAAGGMSRLIGRDDIALVLTYKAAKSTTLLPASAVRSDGGDSYYVYTVNRSYGGLLDSSGYVLSKTTVTVLEKTDQVVSVSEDLSYVEIADREDRALKDGQAVMDYVD